MEEVRGEMLYFGVTIICWHVSRLFPLSFLMKVKSEDVRMATSSVL
jgi:hypothetical protein